MTFFLNLIGFIFGMVLSCYILIAGRKKIWITSGIVALSASANLMAVLVAGVENGRALIEAQAWLLIGNAILAGALGIVLGRFKPDLAVSLIGFIAGADAVIWLYDIAAHYLTRVAGRSENLALWAGILILVVGGLLGLWLVRVRRDEALIFITMVIGTMLLQDTLNLSKTSSWTAVIMLTFALAGVLVQYAVYLREVKAGQTEPEPQASSIAFFQDLELH
jgi:hypothetical protein